MFLSYLTNSLSKNIKRLFNCSTYMHIYWYTLMISVLDYKCCYVTTGRWRNRQWVPNLPSGSLRQQYQCLLQQQYWGAWIQYTRDASWSLLLHAVPVQRDGDRLAGHWIQTRTEHRRRLLLHDRWPILDVQIAATSSQDMDGIVVRGYQEGRQGPSPIPSRKDNQDRA